MKTSKKVSLILFSVFFFILSSTTAIAWQDWEIWGGDIYAWNASYLQNNTYITQNYGWNVSIYIDGFPKSDGEYYINGTCTQNGTVTTDIVLSDLTLGALGSPSGFFIGDVLENEYVDLLLITNPAKLTELRAGMTSFVVEYPYYLFNETVENELFIIWGGGTEGNYIWNYTGVVQYTSDMVLYSVNESYYHEDTSTGFIEEKEYRWLRTYHLECLCGWRPQEIPGYSIPILIVGLIIGTWILTMNLQKSKNPTEKMEKIVQNDVI